jgi:polysaccharide biosynthesis transport protein
MDKNHTKTLTDYLYVIKKYKYYVLVTWCLISVISVLAALSMPKIYRSTATLLIEAPLANKFVESSASQFADEQIQSIFQRIMTTDNVMSIIDTYELYKEIRDTESKQKLAEIFKENTEITLTATTFTPKSISGMADIAFNIAFLDNSPTIAKEIASKLTDLFIAQNDKFRTQRAIKTTDFLLEETDKLNSEIKELDNKIASYKEQYNFSLPDQVQGNLAAIDRTENEIRDTDNLIRTTKERVAYLNAELARLDDYTLPQINDKAPLSKDESLKSLKNEYLRLSSIYTSTHPSLTRLKREIKLLDPNFDGRSQDHDVVKQLFDAEQELELLEETYSNSHPEIIKRKQQIARLEELLKNPKRDRAVESKLERSSSRNPSFVGLEAQYKASQSELISLQEKLQYLKSKLEKMLTAQSLAPQIEKGYNDLIRERENTVKKYNQLKEKLLDAKLIQTQEQEQQGQTITVIEPANIPDRPEKAIRRKIAIGGFVFGLIAGIALAIVQDFLNPKVIGYNSVSAVTGLMPIVIIPYLENPAEELKTLVLKKQEKILIISSITLSVILVTGYLLYYFGIFENI